MKTSLMLILAVVVILLGVAMGTWSAKVVSQRQQTDQVRGGCIRSVQETVILANSLRSDAQANLLIAQDPRQPKKTRDARFHEVFDVELPSLVALDQLIDPRYASFTTSAHDLIALDSQDLVIVTRLKAQGLSFSCENAFKYAPLFP